MTGTAREALMLGGPAGSLEAVVEDAGGDDPRFGLVCHPHPLYGGTMDNKVVTTVARALRDAGMPTVRFNFRGVGASVGVFDGGSGETDDADAVAAWCDRRWPGRIAVFAGFSFGAYVALKLAQRRPPSRLITVAPPVSSFDFHSLAVPRCPWLIVQGDADEVVESGIVSEWAAGLEPRPTLALMSGAGHFFHGRLGDLKDAVRGAIRSD